MKQVILGSLITPSILVAACAEPADVAYCEPKLGIRAKIDFAKAEIEYHDGLLSDQAAQIISCGNGPSECFVGEISYFNPFEIKAEDFPLPAKMTVAADGASRDVEIVTEEFRFRYSQSSPDGMPEKMEVFRKYDSQQFNYERCNF